MVDAIGLGDFLANAFIVFCVLVSLLIAVWIYKLFNRSLTFVWLSIAANIIVFLYFMGIGNIPIQIFIFFIWPAINIALIIFAVWQWRKGRNITHKQ